MGEDMKFQFKFLFLMAAATVVIGKTAVAQTEKFQLGGSARVRSEFRDTKYFSKASGDYFDFIGSRFRFDLKVTATPKILIFVQPQFQKIWGARCRHPVHLRHCASTLGAHRSGRDESVGDEDSGGRQRLGAGSGPFRENEFLLYRAFSPLPGAARRLHRNRSSWAGRAVRWAPNRTCCRSKR